MPLSSSTARIGDIVDRNDIAANERNRPPWTDGMNFRAPAGHMAEQRRAKILEALRRDHLGTPACASAGLGQARTERAEAKGQIIAARQRDRDFMSGEHALGREDFLTVQKNMAERRKPFETKDGLTGLGVEEPADVPGIFRLQRFGIFAIKETGALQRFSHGAWNGRGNELRRRRNVARSCASPRFRQNQIPTLGKRGLLGAHARQSPPHAQAPGIRSRSEIEAIMESHASAAGSSAVCNGSNFLRVTARASWNCTDFATSEMRRASSSARREPPRREPGKMIGGQLEIGAELAQRVEGIFVKEAERPLGDSLHLLRKLLGESTDRIFGRPARKMHV